MSNSDSDSRPSRTAFTILGVTSKGKKFRPSDWSCRLAGPYGTVVQNVIRYNPDVQPVNGGDYPGVRVQSSDPSVADYLEAFAKANDLVIVRDEPADQARSVPPVTGLDKIASGMQTEPQAEQPVETE